MERFEVCSVILGAKREHQRHRLLHPSEGSSLSLHFISDTNGSPVSSGSALTCPRTQVCPPRRYTTTHSECFYGELSTRSSPNLTDVQCSANACSHWSRDLP
jgi:hypothetical protein